LISELQPEGPAARCGNLFIGDAILACNGLDLTTVVHKEAARILSTAPDGDMTLDVQFVTSGEDSDVDDGDPTNPLAFIRSVEHHCVRFRHNDFLSSVIVPSSVEKSCSGSPSNEVTVKKYHVVNIFLNSCHDYYGEQFKISVKEDPCVM
jgi:hypothetical protein